jgi:hypothetical protein
LGSGRAQFVTFGLGLFNLKIGPGAFKIWALLTGLKFFSIKYKTHDWKLFRIELSKLAYLSLPQFFSQKQTRASRQVCWLGLNLSVTKMQEENKIAPSASSHTEIQIRPTSLSAARDELGLKNWATASCGSSQVYLCTQSDI